MFIVFTSVKLGIEHVNLKGVDARAYLLVDVIGIVRREADVIGVDGLVGVACEHVLGSDDGRGARRLQRGCVATLVSGTVVDDEAAAADDWGADGEL